MMKYRDRRSLLVIGLSLAVGVALGYGLRPLCAPPPVAAVAVAPPCPPVAAVAVAPPCPPAAPVPPPAAAHRAALLLPSEGRFRATLRSCVGAACFTATPAGAGVDARIALLAPPSAAADAVFRWYAALVGAAKGPPRIEFVPTAHAPPYGYGKNHGYTRIVRLALPLAASEDGGGPPSLRQHVRWHCRVSHVAAHTAMLTLLGDADFADDAARRRTAELLLSFAGFKVSHDMLDAAERSFARDGVAAALDATLAAPRGDEDALDAALLDELDATQTLRAWPCQSLWVDGADAAAAAALAPNCSKPFTTCSVARDRAEMVGRGAP